ncbi:sulfatase [Beutenbergia cavernae DSM 12333]|uniref:Sulfatase n=1 Tax=Beutenbergia cavernae (strain ATCC BAA-8 / DSM 12333 / CCUG 43141 / JCM 11478 / NBRC 16432 / NCIMB 13614 / HKI 0122) TaxID=471853 RepID=C5C586_BEUC1|nr:sulfatase [Beutenbergia cavernae]ACQ82226.1 sulfatase [Beutenbergia cavernae DSM 12333]
MTASNEQVRVPEPDRPNIVLVVVDDLGWRDLGCFGSTFYETPHIDALAASGTRFTHSYAAAPVCSPTRASLLTGKYPARVGVTNWIGGHAIGALRDVPYFHGLPQDEYALARALRAGGYRTWHVGKWHLGGGRHLPEHHGFDLNVGGSASGSPVSYYAPYGIGALEDAPDGEFLTDRLTDVAVDLVRSSDDAPFLLNLWHYAVHTPIEAPAHLVEKYRHKAETLGLPTHGPDAVEAGEHMPARHLRSERVRRRRIQSDPTYAAMLETLDGAVGRLVTALRDVGKLDDTLIVFTSDNGGLSTAEGSPTCNAPLSEGKGWMADGGTRVPTIVSWPGRVPAGARSDLPFTSPDFYPTLLAAAGLTQLPEQHVDGVNLWPAWQGAPLDRGPIFWHYPHYSNQGGAPSAAVRDGRWKLVRHFGIEHDELFDVVADVSESHDVSGRRRDVVARLSVTLDSWLADVGALIPRRTTPPPDTFDRPQ